MKKIPFILLLFFVGFSKAQQISNYQYVLIPAEFEDFKAQKAYGLKPLLEKTLKSKKYTVLGDDKSQWPANSVSDPCDIISADIIDDKSLFRNKLILQFKDCKGQAVFTEKGNSMIKEFEPGFQDALKQTLVKVPVSNPQVKIIAKTETPPALQEQKTVVANDSNHQNAAQRYSNGSLTLQKIQIDANQFILADAGSSVPFATFKTTTKQDVFRVKLSSGASTIGYFENGNIVIETPNSSGDYTKDVFSAK